MSRPAWTDDLFAAIDAADADRFATFLTEDVRFAYGSQPPVLGRQAVREYVAQFFGMFERVEHRLLGSWQVDDVLFCQGTVTYTKRDGTATSVPFLNLFRLAGERIREYLIYVDPTPLS